MQRFSLIILALVAITGAAWSQEPEEPVSPERPGFTNGTDIVPLGKIQFETGYTHNRESDGRTDTFGDGMQLRFPLRPNLEARLGLPAYIRERGESRIDGLGDTSVGLKYRFQEANPSRTAIPALALIGGLELPTGKKAFREDDYQPSLALEADWQLSERYSLTADAVYNAVRQNGLRFDEWAGGVCLTAQLSPVWGTFGELYRIADTGTGDTHDNFFDTGLIYRVGANTAIDVNGGFGVLGTHDQWFVGGGISRRW